MEKKFGTKFKYGLFVLAGIAMLGIPLLRDFHIESAMLVAVVGCFWAAIRGSSAQHDSLRGEMKPVLAILGYAVLFGLPLFLFAVFTGCFSWNGLGFWLLYPVPSIFLGYSLGRMLRIWAVPFRRTIVVAILLFVAAGVLAIEFFHLPQVYFFNQVWGGWPGPIYDETVKVTWSLIFFRGLTLAWTGLFWWLPSFLQSVKAKIFVIVSVLLLVVGYAQLSNMGIISPQIYLQQQLGGKKKTPHFILYYDKSHFSRDEINFIAQKHEFYYKQITDTLNLGASNSTSKIESYLYAHPWQKKKLVGAKFTSYVPIWLAQDQLHIAKQQIPGSLKHELAHVLAKRFGNKLFNGSWSIGLIEGLAVAISGNESPVSTINQIVVSEKPYPSAVEMKSAFSPWGFYKGRSAVNYTQSGSFVEYLLQNYPVADIKQAYRTGNITDAYDTSWGNLVRGWHATLDTITVDSTDHRVAKRLYGFPSLFEQQCPHVQSVFARQWDQYQYFMAEKDTAEALQHLEEARTDAEDNPLVKSEWAFLNLQSGHAQRVRNQAGKTDTTVDALLLNADAFALAGKMKVARNYVSTAVLFLKMHPDSASDEAVRTRKDDLQWKYYRLIVYNNYTVADSLFKRLYVRTQIRAIQQAINHQQWSVMEHYAVLAADQKLNLTYFDTYIRLIEWLAFKGDKKEADKWLDKLKIETLRPRYEERLKESQRWVHFTKSGLFY